MEEDSAHRKCRRMMEAFKRLTADTATTQAKPCANSSQILVQEPDQKSVPGRHHCGGAGFDSTMPGSAGNDPVWLPAAHHLVTDLYLLCQMKHSRSGCSSREIGKTVHFGRASQTPSCISTTTPACSPAECFRMCKQIRVLIASCVRGRLLWRRGAKWLKGWGVGGFRRSLHWRALKLQKRKCHHKPRFADSPHQHFSFQASLVLLASDFSSKRAVGTGGGL